MTEIRENRAVKTWNEEERFDRRNALTVLEQAAGGSTIDVLINGRRVEITSAIDSRNQTTMTVGQAFSRDRHAVVSPAGLSMDRKGSKKRRIDLEDLKRQRRGQDGQRRVIETLPGIFGILGTFEAMSMEYTGLELADVDDKGETHELRLVLGNDPLPEETVTDPRWKLNPEFKSILGLPTVERNVLVYPINE